MEPRFRSSSRDPPPWFLGVLLLKLTEIWVLLALSDAPPPASPDQTLRCSIHSAERLNIYCLTCGLLTCSLCKVFGSHQSCQVAPLTHICQQKKVSPSFPGGELPGGELPGEGVGCCCQDELQDQLSSLAELNHRIQSVLEQLEDACTSIQVCRVWWWCTGSRLQPEGSWFKAAPLPVVPVSAGFSPGSHVVCLLCDPVMDLTHVDFVLRKVPDRNSGVLDQNHPTLGRMFSVMLGIHPRSTT